MPKVRIDMKNACVVTKRHDVEGRCTAVSFVMKYEDKPSELLFDEGYIVTDFSKAYNFLSAWDDDLALAAAFAKANALGDWILLTVEEAHA